MQLASAPIRCSLSSFVLVLIVCGGAIFGARPVEAQDNGGALSIDVDEPVIKSEPIDIPANAVELPSDVFEHVAIKSIGISAAEGPAYYGILNHAKTIPPQKLREAARELRVQRHRESPLFKHKPIEKFEPFVDLFKQPDAYLGKPVTMSGYARRLTTIPADPNPYGIETLYELWLFTDDSQNNPLVVVSTEIPDNLPRGDELINGISVTGFFFKLYGYDAADSKRLAPMILAARIEWNPPEPIEPLPISSWILYPAAIGVIALVLFLLWYTEYRDRVNSPLRRGTLSASGKLTFGDSSAESDPAPFQMPPVFPDPRGDDDRKR